MKNEMRSEITDLVLVEPEVFFVVFFCPVLGRMRKRINELTRNEGMADFLTVVGAIIILTYFKLCCCC